MFSPALPAVVFLVAAGSTLAGEPALLPVETIQQRFAALRPANEDRAVEIRRLFSEAGCDVKHYSEQRFRSSPSPNIICTLPGESRRTIVVSAHYDRRKGAGEGAIDNWSGAALLPSLFESLRAEKRRYTFEFVAFTDEEIGLIGSREYVQNLSKQQRADLLLGVNVDCVGLAGPIRIAAERAHDLLLSFAAVVGEKTKVGVGADVLGPMYDSDASPFAGWGIPVIDFHSLTRDTLSILHGKRDVRTALDGGSYYNHYRFLAAFLAYLDSNVER